MAWSEHPMCRNASESRPPTEIPMPPCTNEIAGLNEESRDSGEA